MIVGLTVAATPYGEITVCGNSRATTASMGILNFANYNTTGTEKRIAAVVAFTDGAANWQLAFYTWNASSPAQGMNL